MLAGMLGLLLMAQVPKPGPTAGPVPPPTVERRSADGVVLGTIGARDANMIEAAKLATTKATGANAKSFAAAELKAHGLSLTEGTRLAKQLRVTLVLPADSAMARQQADAMAKLNVLSGVPFDLAYVRYVVDDHKAAIIRLNGPLLAQATKPQVRTFVRQRVVMLRSHQAMGEQLLVAHP